jgi:hypothetical protein
VTMNYPQHQAYPPPYTPPAPATTQPKRWPWILVVGIGAFLFGVLVGIASKPDAGTNSAGGTTVTVTAPAADAAAPVENPRPAPAGPATTMGGGVYQVGIDVLAGQYKTTGSENGIGCYWARLKNDSGEFDAIIANGNVDGPGSVTINDGEFVDLTGDCTWTKVG